MAATGRVAWQEVVIAVLIGLSGVATVGYVSSHTRISAERKRMFDELRAAQEARRPRSGGPAWLMSDSVWLATFMAR